MMLKIAALSMPLWIIIATAVIRHEVRLGIVESNHFTLTDAVQIKDMISERKHASMQLKAQIEELDRIARDNAARVRAMEGYLMRLSQQTEIEVPVPYRPKAG